MDIYGNWHITFRGQEYTACFESNIEKQGLITAPGITDPTLIGGSGAHWSWQIDDDNFLWIRGGSVGWNTSSDINFEISVGLASFDDEEFQSFSGYILPTKSPQALSQLTPPAEVPIPLRVFQTRQPAQAFTGQFAGRD